MASGVWLAAAALVLPGGAFAKGDCLEYEQPGVEFTGSVAAVDSRRTGKRIRYWVLRLPSPVCIERGNAKADAAESNVREIQLAFAEDSPYYNIYKSVVDGRSSFKVTGTLEHSRAAHPLRKVILRVEDFVPRSRQ